MNRINIVAMALAAVMLLAAGVVIGYIMNGDTNYAIAPLIISNNPVNFYGISDDNSTAIVTKNATFGLVLDENPTTGYQWSLNLTGGLSIVSDKYVPGNESLIGAGGIHVWVIEATGLGNQTLSACYQRPWENATSNEGQFYLNVIVHDLNENGSP